MNYSATKLPEHLKSDGIPPFSGCVHDTTTACLLAIQLLLLFLDFLVWLRTVLSVFRIWKVYDGFYAVITNLKGDISEIIKINKQRWEIEENFRIMKTEFEARPVYVRREDRIKAHFMTCYISLLLYRLLEKKLGDIYTTDQILETLRSMQMTLLNTSSGYIPSYTRTELTDALHKIFDFRTDYEFITKAAMRTLIKDTKQIKSKLK